MSDDQTKTIGPFETLSNWLKTHPRDWDGSHIMGRGAMVLVGSALFSWVAYIVEQEAKTLPCVGWGCERAVFRLVGAFMMALCLLPTILCVLAPLVFWKEVDA